MPTEILSIRQYAKTQNKSRQAILKAIADLKEGKKKEHLLPGVLSKKKVGNYYVLEVAI